MKKILNIVLVIAILAGISPVSSLKAKDVKETYFIVTAYYSPLPGQKFYLKGNYEDEKTLNGQGVRGTSGKKVFSGMLAAPKGYSFGTKIYLEGLGVGEVADRGGAIVHAGKRGYEYDRIDVWMGYGDEGLRRALYWGKRKVKGKILSNFSKINLDYKKIPSPLWATKNLKSIPSIFNKGIGKKSDKKLVIELQKFLSKIGLYTGDIDGKYNSKLIDIVYNFQLQNGLIKDSNSYGAGYWGIKTRNLVFKKYLNGDFDKKQERIEKITHPLTPSLNTNKRRIKELEIFNSKADTKQKVKNLQEILKKLGLYSGKITGDYKDTVDSITDYQLKNKIIKKIGDPGTGYFGPKTRASLKKDYKEFLKQEEIKKQKALEEEKRKKALEEKFKYLESISQKQAQKEIASIGTPKKGDISPAVRKLQNILKLLGFFDYKDTAIFGEITQKAILKYQLEKSIVSSPGELGAGIFGPNTKKSIKNDLAKYYLEQKIKQDKSLAEYKNKIKSEKEKSTKNLISTEKIEIVVGDNLRF